VRSTIARVLVALAVSAGAASAQSTSPVPTQLDATSGPGATGPGALVQGEIDGSPAPVPPATITRDDRQRPTVRAIKLPAPLVVDGLLDEGVYEDNPPFGDFIQVVPQYGAAASERTDVWVTYDEDNIYVSARVWDSAPPEQWVSNELRRDTNQLSRTITSPSASTPSTIAAAGSCSTRTRWVRWPTTRWWTRARPTRLEPGVDQPHGRFDGGWTVEIAVPFKTLRYTSGSDRIWGFQMRRSIRRKNEWAYLSPVPQNLAGPMALNRVSSNGTLVGLDLPPAARNMEIKPYVLARSTTDTVQTPRLSNDVDALVGGDFKYGITANLTADLTVNTDFAQVEVDEQQVNLTRFSLFLPEKRDFFLEGRGNFDFGRGSGGGPGGGGASDTPTLFYSRRIGLNRGRVVPIDVGGRLTGKVGKWGVGAVNIQAGDEGNSLTEATNFTVLRVKRDILRRSTIGAIFTHRSSARCAPATTRPTGWMPRLPSTRTSRLAPTTPAPTPTASLATTRATRGASSGRRIATACAPST
jgi:hypothetical protein